MSDDFDNHQRIPISKVRSLCGVTDMTIWRWLRNDKMKFPKPIYIGNRRYWRLADIIMWLESTETTDNSELF